MHTQTNNKERTVILLVMKAKCVMMILDDCQAHAAARSVLPVPGALISFTVITPVLQQQVFLQ
jgi:hypothetical protein